MSGPHIVIIGAGIVGCALADELTARGRTDVTVLDQGPLFATGGSTSHAPGLVFQTTAHPVMTRFAQATVAKYSGLRHDGARCFRPVGGLEVATTPERLADLHRRAGWAAAAGVDTELLDPAQVAARHPLVERDAVLGGLHIPSDGLAVPLAAAEAQARAAQARGARFRGHTRVLGIEVRGGRTTGVHTDHGHVAADVVVSCAGMWGPLVGALAGVAIPLYPMTHQYAWSTPLPELDVLGRMRGMIGPAGTSLPILRHQDADLYVREHGDRLGVGAYGHRAMPVPPTSLGTGSEDPFTPEDFEPSWAAAVTLLPALDDAKVERGINGLFSFTPDGMPLVGEHPDVAGFWAAEAVWITHSAGVAEAVAEWLTTGAPSVGGEPVDPAAVHLDRFDPATLAPVSVRARASTAFDEVYDIAHPEAPVGARPLRTTPFHARHRELGAVPGEHPTEGWSLPRWFTDNADLPEVCEVRPRHGWAARHWSAVIGAEALVARRAVVLTDRTARRRVQVSGPNALGLLQQLATGDVDVAVGTRMRTLLLDRAGRIRADVDLARVGATEYLVGATDRLEVAWLAGHALGDVSVRDVTAGTCAVGVWGPRAHDVLALEGDVVDTVVGPVAVRALRGTPVGLPGWELQCSADVGLALWDTLWEAGAACGMVAAGTRAARSLALESGERRRGLGVEADLTPPEAGLEHLVEEHKGPFLGRDACLRAGPDRRLVTLVLDDVVLGGEPVRHDGVVVARVTTADSAYSRGVTLARALLPAASATPGTELTVDWFGTALAARVVQP